MTFTIGQRVAYRASFIKSTQLHSAASYRGEVVDLQELGYGRQLATVRWDHGATMRIACANLAPIGPNLRFADPSYTG